MLDINFNQIVEMIEKRKNNAYKKATGQHKEINMRTGILIITDIYIVIKMIFVITFYVIHIVNI